MKAVAPDALLVVLARQREGIGHERVAAVKRGVEAGHLRRPREGDTRRVDAGQIVRLVQRRQRHQGFELGPAVVVDHDRLDMLGPAMHHAMADGRDLAVREAQAQPVQHALQGMAVVGHRAVEPLLVAFARGRDGAEMRALAQPLDLADGQAIQAMRALLEQRELDRRRTGVEGQQQAHACTSRSGSIGTAQAPVWRQ